jgi:hypothetical protein
MTTDTSAGPLVLDSATRTLIYVDNNAISPFIGKLLLTRNSTVSSSSVLSSFHTLIFPVSTPLLPAPPPLFLSSLGSDRFDV